MQWLFDCFCEFGFDVDYSVDAMSGFQEENEIKNLYEHASARVRARIEGIRTIMPNPA